MLDWALRRPSRVRERAQRCSLWLNLCSEDERYKNSPKDCTKVIFPDAVHFIIIRFLSHCPFLSPRGAARRMSISNAPGRSSQAPPETQSNISGSFSAWGGLTLLRRSETWQELPFTSSQTPKAGAERSQNRLPKRCVCVHTHAQLRTEVPREA